MRRRTNRSLHFFAERRRVDVARSDSRPTRLMEPSYEPAARVAGERFCRIPRSQSNTRSRFPRGFLLTLELCAPSRRGARADGVHRSALEHPHRWERLGARRRQARGLRHGLRRDDSGSIRAGKTSSSSSPDIDMATSISPISKPLMQRSISPLISNTSQAQRGSVRSNIASIQPIAWRNSAGS